VRGVFTFLSTLVTDAVVWVKLFAYLKFIPSRNEVSDEIKRMHPRNFP